ncbi:hypothetical protein BDV93DRAFT_225392 [Ceratobasidium sp. AG-I]|nr:hypothetical protein BDV93DRAFT_225392 [Ceratobasidium sp. AG-I]
MLGDIKTPFGSGNTSNACVTDSIHSLINTRNITDRFRRYSCSYNTRQNLGFRYIVSAKNTTTQALASDFPRLWFQQILSSSETTQSNDTVVPYLVSPLEPSPGMYSLFGLEFTERRFITSSGIFDTITGSKPTYGKTIVMYRWRQISSRPIYPADNISTGGSYQNIAYGAVLWPDYVTSALGLTQTQLDEGAPGYMCQVIEDYRASSAFDVLGSIGGFLALLQGIHLFLFGRPLFLGLFGTKLITPFGLVGRLATKGFRRRLRNRYHRSDIQNEGNIHMQDTTNMTQFLLDYVLDMGPAFPQKPKSETLDAIPIASDVELSQLSQNQDLRHRYSSSTVVPLLTAEGAHSQPQLGSLRNERSVSTASSLDSIPLKQ